MTNIENEPGDGKCSVEFQATEQSVIFEQSESIFLCQMDHNTEDIALITSQTVCSFFF